jgi:hypothetical protein
MTQGVTRIHRKIALTREGPSFRRKPESRLKKVLKALDAACRPAGKSGMTENKQFKS